MASERVIGTGGGDGERPAGGGASLVAVVLAGGRARRFGSDKTRAVVAGASLLERAVAAVPAGVRIVVVGPPAALSAGGAAGREVRFVREEPAFGGPVAGLDAGCRAAGSVGVVLVLAADQPFAATAVPRLLAALAGGREGGGTGDVAGGSAAEGSAAEGTAAEGSARCDGVLGVDPDGRRQPLLAAYRLAPLRAALAARDPAGRSMRDLLAGLRLVEVPVAASEALDVDTPDDLPR